MDVETSERHTWSVKFGQAPRWLGSWFCTACWNPSPMPSAENSTGQSILVTPGVRYVTPELKSWLLGPSE